MPFLSYQNNRIHYKRFGKGDQLLLAVHGFADVGDTFSILEGVLSKKYTVIAFDLPFHGQTDWKKEYYTLSDIEAIFMAFCKKEGKDTVSLMGHSMGTRLIIKVLPRLAPQVEHLFF